ncbi:hypothetical protein HN974_03090 [bacterium]|nr:hypothetical protein [bacterium]MBT7037787.1 hypothetical protein [bacterium]
MVKCEITSIETGAKEDFALLRPLIKLNIGIIGSITCAISKISGIKKPKEKDLVIAYNVHRVTKGWRAQAAKVSN